MTGEQDVFGKMDALLRKHQPATTGTTPDPIPTLTEVSGEDFPLLTDIAAAADNNSQAAAKPAAQAAMPTATASTGIDEAQIARIRAALQQNLSEIIEVAATELVAQYQELLPQLIDDALKQALQKKTD